MFDINKIEESKNATFNVDVGENQQTGEKVGFIVVGQGSDQHLKVTRDIEVFNVKAAAGRKGPLDMKTDEAAGSVVDTGSLHKRMYLSACIVGWYGFKIGDEDAPFNEENLWKVLSVRPRWINKLIESIEVDANFAGG